MNKRLGIGEQEVFVTESYLKKRQEEEKIKKEEERVNEEDKKNSVLNGNEGKMHDFRRRLLD